MCITILFCFLCLCDFFRAHFCIIWKRACVFVPQFGYIKWVAIVCQCPMHNLAIGGLALQFETRWKEPVKATFITRASVGQVRNQDIRQFIIQNHLLCPLVLYPPRIAQANSAAPTINIIADSNWPMVSPQLVKNPICASGMRNCSQNMRAVAYAIPSTPPIAPACRRSPVKRYMQYINANKTIPSAVASYKGLGCDGICV